MIFTFTSTLIHTLAPKPVPIVRVLPGLLIAVMLVLTPFRTFAACSPYLGLATINEINKQKANGKDNASDFVEIKILDTSIPTPEYTTWNLTIQENGGQGPKTFPLSGFDDTVVPWVIQQGMDVAIYIDLDTGMNLILKDGSGDVIDYLDYDTSDGFTPLADGSCSAFVFDTTVATSSGGVKRMRRKPDGTGDWDSVNAQSIDPTLDTTNDDVPPGAPDVSVSNIEVGIGSDAVFTVTLSATSGTDVVINYATSNGTASAGSDYVAKSGSVTIPAGSLTAEITISTLGTATLGEKFSLLLNSSTAVVLTSVATATFIAATAGLDHFLISHDGSGINCLQEVITLSAIDGSSTVLTNYADQVTLDTQSGKGTWTLNSGAGTFADATSNDGLATYTFVAADNGTVSFNLSYEEGSPTLDVDAWQSSNSLLRDDDTESSLVFGPSGFTLTRSALSNPPPNPINNPLLTQSAGTNFDVHITAFGQTPTDPVCGVIEAYTGAKPLAFWFDYNNPTSGSIVPTIDATGISATEAGASTQSVTFLNGQTSVSMKYKDVGQLSLSVKDGTISGGSNAFVSKPANLVLTDIETISGVNNPGATNATGPGFVAAGSAFRVQVEARDAEGDVTPNFGNELVPEGIKISAVNLVVPATGTLGNISNSTNFNATGTPGVFSGDTFSWNEYGIMQLQATIADGDYLGSLDVAGTVSGNVGRFIPATFTLVSGSVVGACNSVTYMGQPGMSMSFDLRAQNAAGANLANYDLGLLGASGVASPVIHAENSNAGTDLASRLSVTLPAWSNGIYSLTLAAGTFTRLAAPDGPFNTLLLGISVTDTLDSLTIANPNQNPVTSTDCVAASNCSAKLLTGTTQVRYGRMEVAQAFGPETETLEMPLKTAYFNGSGFVVNTADDCTSYANTGVTLSNYQGGLPAVGAISPATTLVVNGKSVTGSGLTLSSPGAGNTGSVDVTYSVPGWLKYNWGGAGDINPTGTALFGHFRGHDSVIYWREVF